MEAEDFIKMFKEESTNLPALPPPIAAEGSPPLPAASGDWQEDPLAVKLDKIRAAFLNGKTAGEVEAEAARMHIGDWLELVVKLSPKNIQVKGDVSFRHMLEQMGPIDRETYRFKVIDAEYKELPK